MIRIRFVNSVGTGRMAGLLPMANAYPIEQEDLATIMVNPTSEIMIQTARPLFQGIVCCKKLEPLD